MHEQTSFGWWVKQRRRALDLTQEALAERVGCSVDTVRKIERDARRPSRQMAMLLAQALGVPKEKQEQLVRQARSELRDDRILQVGSLPMESEQPPNYLPIQLSSFVGRERERARVAHLLSDVRLLTLTGAAGTGKTRLALQVAEDLLEDFEHGVYFVALASVNDPFLLASTITHTIGLREDGLRSPLDTLKVALRENQTLLILDNFEHLLSATQLIVELLQSAPGLKVLVTSREPLHVYGESEFPVSPLEVPNIDTLPALEELKKYPSIILFGHRARAVNPDFGLSSENARAIAELCFHLDGLPLAIELAAARIKLFSPQAMLGRLGIRFSWLTYGESHLPSRHQTLRKAIDWSYNLLEEGELRIFERLSVFVGGCTIEAVEAVCNVDVDLSLDVFEGLASLVDKNLLVQEEVLKGEPRFGMLETIREYAREKLETSGEAETIKQRHFAHFLKLAEMAEAQRRGPEEGLWLHRFEIEHDNLRAALNHGLEREDAEATLQLVATLEWFWSLRGYLSEGSKWMDRVLTECRNVAAPIRTKALLAAEHLAQKRGDFLQKKRYAEEHFELSRSVGDSVGIAWALHSLGDVARDLEGDYGQAATLLTESVALFRELDEWSGMAGALNCLGEVARCQEKYQQAKIFYDESLALERQLEDKERIALVTFNLGSVELYHGALDKAEARFKISLALSQELGNKSIIALCLAGLAGISREMGNPMQAARLLAAASFINETIGAKLDKADRAEWDRILAAVHTELDQVSFAEAWAKGGKMTIEQAISSAFEVSANR
jgi:predicted ATPase/DNA-binding XRE family transcriptional regulator